MVLVNACCRVPFKIGQPHLQRPRRLTSLVSVISGTSVAWIFKHISPCCSLSILSGYSVSFQKQTQNRIFL
jgi:hypothetical protein